MMTLRPFQNSVYAAWTRPIDLSQLCTYFVTSFRKLSLLRNVASSRWASYEEKELADGRFPTQSWRNMSIFLSPLHRFDSGLAEPVTVPRMASAAPAGCTGLPQRQPGNSLAWRRRSPATRAPATAAPPHP